MTKAELEKATGQELIEQRNYCGVDGYYGDYLNDVNTEMLKRFNRLVELEKENAELKEQIKELKKRLEMGNKVYNDNLDYSHHIEESLTKAKDIIKELYEGLDKLYLSGLSAKQIAFIEQLQDKAEQFLKEVSE